MYSHSMRVYDSYMYSIFGSVYEYVLHDYQYK